MNWVLFVARRYLKSKRNTEFLSLSSLLSMGGIGLGVAAIIIVLSVMSGFEKQLREKLVTSDLHVLITPEHSFPGFESGWVPKAGMNALPALAAISSSPEVDLMSYQLSTEVVIRNGNKVSGILIKGVESEKFSRVKKSLVEEALPQMLVDREGPNAIRYPGIFVGKELAYEMGLIPGDFVTVISPSQMDGPFNNIPRLKRFVVEGIYHFGVPEQESHVAYTAISNVESFLRKKGVVSEIEIALQDSSRSTPFIGRFRSELTDLKARDWNDLNANLFASMRLERLAMFLILLFTVIISSLNIVSTLTLLVQEKIKEISILKTMGATPKSIRAIFVWKGILIGGSGVFFGTVGALVICIMLKKYQFISLPEVYYDRTLPVTFDPVYLIGVPVISFLIVCIASYFPARGAARLTPLEGIREY
jgi:lipoprotein-releasing system permease protein